MKIVGCSGSSWQQVNMSIMIDMGHCLFFIIFFIRWRTLLISVVLLIHSPGLGGVACLKHGVPLITQRDPYPGWEGGLNKPKTPFMNHTRPHALNTLKFK